MNPFTKVAELITVHGFYSGEAKGTAPRATCLWLAVSSSGYWLDEIDLERTPSAERTYIKDTMVEAIQCIDSSWAPRLFDGSIDVKSFYEWNDHQSEDTVLLALRIASALYERGTTR